jgi:hypothetical protein
MIADEGWSTRDELLPENLAVIAEIARLGIVASAEKQLL